MEREASIAELSLTAFLENYPGLTWIVNEEGLMKYMNASGLASFGLNKTDLGKNIADIFPATIANYHLRSYKNIFRTGKSRCFNESRILPDGKLRTFRVLKFIFGAGPVKLIGAIAVDVSNEIISQQNYDRELERFELIGKATSEATWDIDIDTGGITTAGAVKSVFGQIKNRGPEAESFSHVHPDDRQKVKQSFYNFLKTKKIVWENVYRVRNNHGKSHFVINKVFVLRAKNGKAIRVVGAARNISHEIVLHEALVLKERQLQWEMAGGLIDLQERERRELAHELHENLGQLLATTGLLMDKACETCNKALMAESKKVLFQAIDELRRLHVELSAETINFCNFYDIMNNQIQKFSRSGSGKGELIFDINEERLSPRLKLGLLRIVQEQLRNITRHAKASAVKIYLASKRNSMVLVIEDNGIGFDPAAVEHGIGLKSIKSRTDYLGGTFAVLTAENKGCRLSFKFRL